MTRVTFGVSSAPHTAIKTIQHLADLYKNKYPVGAAVLKHDFYVDDCVSGADSVDDAIVIKQQIIALLEQSHFHITKWNSNSTDLIDPDNDGHLERLVSFDVDDTSKTLGLYWNTLNDCFRFRICLEPMIEVLTKRSMLSDVSKIFDPLGFLSPVTIKAKIILQRLWLTGLTWDERLPEELINTWSNYRHSLHLLEKIDIPRWLGSESDNRSIQLHGFSDASIKAYAAVVYLRVCNNSTKSTSTQLLVAKTRVAPVKTVTLPRLELCGAVLLANLLKQVIDIFKFTDVQIFAWTDASIVLSWLKGDPSRWKPFVSNRVIDILNLLDPKVWRHVSGEDNPADCASRGINPVELKDHRLWWNGPEWLKEAESCWPKSFLPVTTELESRIITSVHSTIQGHDFKLIERFSSFDRLLRTMAFVLRFINNLKIGMPKLRCWLTSIELQNALKCLIIQVQTTEFGLERSRLIDNKPIVSRSILLSLNPFCDGDGILRVGGRLNNAGVSFDLKHPIILPSKSHFTNLYINKLHHITMHGGPHLLMNIARRKYWILNARRTIRNQLHRCVRCHRLQPQFQTQLMGQLPSQRVNMSTKPFLHTGVDYAGPLDIKLNKTRTSQLCKSYICLFICMATRAIHLELVTDLSSSSFIVAFKNFISRRGRCSHLYSDCGTNFIGASKILHQDFQRSKLESEIAGILANDGVTWEFLAPGSRHHGGLWEAGVKSTKFHLQRVLGATKLTYEHMQSVLMQIEAILNSRPIQPLTTDPNDLEALTPGHFLVGEPLISVPEPSLLLICENHLDIYQRIQSIKQSFWKRWSQEYISKMQQRPKWMTEHTNLHVGDLVIIKQDNMPPSKWLMGRIVEVHPGADGLVRVVTLKTINGIIKRPITKLSLLPIQPPQPTEN